MFKSSNKFSINVERKSPHFDVHKIYLKINYFIAFVHIRLIGLVFELDFFKQIVYIEIKYSP